MKKYSALHKRITLMFVFCLVVLFVLGCSSEEGKKENDVKLHESEVETVEQGEISKFPEYTGLDYTFSRFILDDVLPENKRSFNLYHNTKKLNNDVLPLYRFDSFYQWMEYKKAFGTDASKVYEMFKKYDEAFFENNSLFIFHAFSYKNKWFNVESVTNDDGTLDISLFSNQMWFNVYYQSHQFYSIGVLKKDLENCETIVVQEKNVEPNSLALLHKLDDNDPRAEVVRAFLNKDYAKMEKLAGLPKGTLDAYNTFDITSFILNVHQASAGEEYLVSLSTNIKLKNEDEKDESLAINYGSVLFEVCEEEGYYHLVYRNEISRNGGIGGPGSHTYYLNGWLNNPWFEHEFADKEEGYTHLGWSYSDSIYYFLYSFYRSDAANNDKKYTDNEIAKMCRETAKNIFKLEDHSGFETNFKLDEKGNYQFITGRKQIETVIDIVEQYNDGALVQFYADYGCTVKSHLVKYSYEPTDIGIPANFRWEIVEQSKYEPYRLFFRHVIY